MTDGVWWIVVAGATAPVWGTFLWHQYTFRVRPHFAPREIIQELVAFAARQDDPEEAAFRQEHAAWSRGSTWEQGVWRRVRRELRAGRGRALKDFG